MPLLAKPQWDIIIDAMVAKLQAFSTAQEVFDARAAFDVERGAASPREDVPLVIVYLAEGQPSSQSRRDMQIDVTINVDMIATAGQNVATVGGYTAASGDIAAYNRLSYLTWQVFSALCSLVNDDYGLAKGIIAKKEYPRLIMFPANDQQSRDMVAARWAFHIDFELSMLAASAVDLAITTTTTGIVAANFNY